MNTSLKINYDLVDDTALADSFVYKWPEDYNQNQPFIDTSIFNELTPPNPPLYMTLEPNRTLLDGTYVEMPDVPTDIAWMGAGILPNEQFEISFDDTHTSNGITIHFFENYPDKIRVQWYSDVALESLIVKDGWFFPNELDFFVNSYVENYKFIIIYIYNTNGRFSRINYIDYGTRIEWDSSKLISGNLLEESDVNSDKISINTLEFKANDENGDFELGNTNGLVYGVNKGQHLTATEYLDGVETFLGDFYMQTFSSQDGIVSFKCTDRIGRMDNFDFNDGAMYNGVRAETILDAIFSSCGITSYTIDSVTADTLIYGTIKPMTCRKALREVLFATNSIVDTSRSDSVDIFKQNKTIQSTISKSRKFSTNVTQNEYVSSVVVNYYTWKLDTSLTEIVSETFPSGQRTIYFDNPYSGYTVNTGTIVASGAYFITVNLTTEATLTINAYKYESQKMSATKTVDYMPSNMTENVKTFDGYCLNYKSALSKAENLLDYYGQLLTINCEFINYGEKTSEFVKIQNPTDGLNPYIAGIESISTDLTGGFSSKIKAVGIYGTTNEFNYCGEFYCGEWGLI